MLGALFEGAKFKRRRDSRCHKEMGACLAGSSGSGGSLLIYEHALMQWGEMLYTNLTASKEIESRCAQQMRNFLLNTWMMALKRFYRVTAHREDDTWNASDCILVR